MFSVEKRCGWWGGVGDYFFFFWGREAAPTRALASTFMWFLDHTQRRTTISRTTLDE